MKQTVNKAMCKPSSGLLLAFPPPMSVRTQPGQTYIDQYPIKCSEYLVARRQKLTAFQYLLSSFARSHVQSKPGKTEPEFFFFGIMKNTL